MIQGSTLGAYLHYYEKALLDDVAKIRYHLEHSNSFVEMHCFNRAEVDEMAAYFSEEERKRIRFFWMVWERRADDIPRKG